MSTAITITAGEEALADDAFLMLTRLRDRLLLRGARLSARNVDEAIAKLQTACRQGERP